MVLLDGFFEHCVHAVGMVDGGFVINPTRDHDNGDFVALVAQCKEQLFAVDLAGHMQVEENELHRVLAEDDERLVAGLGCDGGIAHIRQNARQDQANGLFVFDDENGLGVGIHGQSVWCQRKI